MKLITAAQAAQIIFDAETGEPVSKNRVLQLVRKGRLTNHKIGREVLLERAEVERFAQLARPSGRPPKEK